ncbi:MAG: sialate O-acetylesterase [Gemmataceae bacterium]
MRARVTAFVAFVAFFATAFANKAAAQPIKVFILAGQSNMQGKAKISVIEKQLETDEGKKLYGHLKNGDAWITRKDVFIRYGKDKGPLTVGYHQPKSIGPELGFGLVVGDRYEEPVLLIKTAWGGRSLYRDFRSPSAGLPSEKVLEGMLANLNKNNEKNKKPAATIDDVKKTFGATYREMMDEIRTTLDDMQTYVPGYANRGYELAGFVWFQGWNDMIDANATAEYAANLKHFIRDVRKDLKSPKLPFIVGEMGVDGVNAGGGVKKFKDAQAAGVADPEFRGNASLVKTDALWDTEAEAIFKKGWRENLVAWNRVGSDFPYHYLGSPKTMLRIGQAFGDAILELRGESKPKR